MRTCYLQQWISSFACIAFCLGGTTAFVAAEIKPDFLMDSDPQLQVPEPAKDFNPAMAALWIAALEQPENDIQRMAAETIASAHEFGIPDLTRAVPQLERILTTEAAHPAARFAAARALIVLESRGSEQKLFDVSQSSGADLKQIIEPALAVWNNAAVKSLWIQRIKTPESGPRDLMLAVQGLGKTRETSALDGLLSIVNDMNLNPSVRLEAALAAGNIAETGLESAVDGLVKNTEIPHFVNQLCAIRLLARHAGENARQTLTAMASHEEPVVAAAALERLNEIDFSLVLPMAESAMKNPDPQVRRQGAVSMLQLPDISHVVPLSQLLADPQPALRRDICEGLLRLSEKPEFSDPVRDAAMQILSGDKWQGHEQAALLLGSLKYQPAADQLITLLDSPRDEVRVSSAWALRRIAVPDTAPVLIDRATQRTKQRSEKGDTVALDKEVAHLFEAIGVLKAEAATPLLLRYVPKRAGWYSSRGAAIWALGVINEGKRNAELETLLADRIQDFEPQPSESLLVKQMSVVGLGRMKAVDQAPMLKQYAMSEDVKLILDVALGWAVRELTGEVLPAPDPPVANQGSWFLEPLP